MKLETTIQDEIECSQLRCLVDKFYLPPVGDEWNVCDGSEETFFIELMSCEIARETGIKMGFYYEESFPWKCFLNYSQASIKVGVE